MSKRRKIIVEVTMVVLIYGLAFLSWFLQLPGVLHLPYVAVLRYDLPPVAMEALIRLVCCIFAAVATVLAIIFCLRRHVTIYTQSVLALIIVPAIMMCLFNGAMCGIVVRDPYSTYRFWEKNSLTMKDVALLVRDITGTFEDEVKVPAVSSERLMEGQSGVLRYRVKANSDGQTYEQYPAREGGYYTIFWHTVLRYIEYRGPAGDTQLIWHENEVRLMNGEVVKWK